MLRLSGYIGQWRNSGVENLEARWATTVLAAVPRPRTRGNQAILMIVTLSGWS